MLLLTHYIQLKARGHRELFELDVSLCWEGTIHEVQGLDDEVLPAISWPRLYYSKRHPRVITVQLDMVDDILNVLSAVFFGEVYHRLALLVHQEYHLGQVITQILNSDLVVEVPLYCQEKVLSLYIRELCDRHALHLVVHVEHLHTEIACDIANLVREPADLVDLIIVIFRFPLHQLRFVHLLVLINEGEPQNSRF